MSGKLSGVRKAIAAYGAYGGQKAFPFCDALGTVLNFQMRIQRRSIRVRIVTDGAFQTRLIRLSRLQFLQHGCLID